MPAGNGGRRTVRQVARRRYLLQRVVAAAVLTAAVLALVNSGGVLAGDNKRLARAEPERPVLAANVVFRALVRPTPAVQPMVDAAPAPQSTTPPADIKPAATADLPSNSGSGKRIVYDISAQQVWLVNADGTVARTYRVSGSKYDQLSPGSYQVFSRSRHATSWHGTESMQYMVRFHQGARSNIGFHDIPIDTSTGDAVQTLADLGTPLSDGCIRQDVVDAKALWRFASVGTQVVVLR
jgi:lipoprotein-anchoring transpeptidase ErfK/SrfK